MASCQFRKINFYPLGVPFRALLNDRVDKCISYPIWSGCAQVLTGWSNGQHGLNQGFIPIWG